MTLRNENFESLFVQRARTSLRLATMKQLKQKQALERTLLNYMRCKTRVNKNEQFRTKINA